VFLLEPCASTSSWNAVRSGWFIANCYFVAQTRYAAGDVYGYSLVGLKERAKEDEWGFGQIVPLLLLMLPTMTSVATWHGKCIFFDGGMLLTLAAEMKEEDRKDELQPAMQDWHEVNS
jgi:hypothetical protein